VTAHKLTRGALYLLAGLVFAAGLVAQAPAAWLDLLVSRASHGAVRLAEPSGSLWSGRGQLQLAPDRLLASDLAPHTRGPAPAEALGGASENLVLVQAFDWKIRVAVLPLRVLVQLQSPQLQGPVRQQPIVWSSAGLQVPDGQLRLPWLDLAQSQGALALARASLSVDLSWQSLVFTGSGLGHRAEINLLLNDLALGLSPIRPLGNYRVAIRPGLPGARGEINGLTWSLSSLGDPVLQLDGQGRFNQALSGRVQMACRRSCEFVVGLLSVMGRKNGEIYELVLGS